MHLLFLQLRIFTSSLCCFGLDLWLRNCAKAVQVGGRNITGVINVDTLLNPTSNLHGWEPQDTTNYFITRHCNVSQRKTMTTACQLFQLFSEEQEWSEGEVGLHNTSPRCLTNPKLERAVSPASTEFHCKTWESTF